jgi:TRAP-type C4-dicarboxylate transport system permease small subunit
MRLSAIVGVLLIVFGIAVFALGLRYSHQETVIEVGDFHAKVTERDQIPKWVGGVAIVIGGVLLLGARRGRRG